MDAFHERLATIGLAAAERYGFALAGGYAVQAAGLLERPSEDVDLFTAWDRRSEFDAALDRHHRQLRPRRTLGQRTAPV